MKVSLKRLKMSSPIPPKVAGKIFSDFWLYDNCELIVPEESMELYKEHPIFKRFHKVSGYESGVETVLEENRLCSVYSIGGLVVSEGIDNGGIVDNLVPGIYFLRFLDGRIKKVVIK